MHHVRKKIMKIDLAQNFGFYLRDLITWSIKEKYKKETKGLEK